MPGVLFGVVSERDSCLLYGYWLDSCGLLFWPVRGLKNGQIESGGWLKKSGLNFRLEVGTLK